jgi:hypothetical protein
VADLPSRWYPVEDQSIERKQNANQQPVDAKDEHLLRRLVAPGRRTRALSWDCSSPREDALAPAVVLKHCEHVKIVRNII